MASSNKRADQSHNKRILELRRRVERGEGAPLTTSEVAALSGYETRTIHDWATSGRIPFFRTPGQHLRFRTRDVAALLSGLPKKKRRGRGKTLKMVLCRSRSRNTFEAQLGEVDHFCSDPYEALVMIGRFGRGLFVVQQAALGGMSAVAFVQAVRSVVPSVKLILVGQGSPKLKHVVLLPRVDDLAHVAGTK